MRLWVLSDLHLEYADLHEPLDIADADVCICAGDLTRFPANGVHWLGEHIARWMPVIYVAGNHEFYKGGIRECLEDGRAAATRFPNVHFLENDSVVIDGVRFIGATLWTDFRIEGSPQLAMTYARERMNDYRMIALQRSPWKRFLPVDAAKMHHGSRSFIRETLATPFDGETVVVTHHLPSKKSVPDRFAGDLLNAAYASDLSEIIEEGKPDLWVHGHTHDSCDYVLGDTRVVCNPRGYDDENPKFDHHLVVETGSPAPRPGIGGGR
jgi:Icc-related predicted phosphoesterase